MSIISRLYTFVNGTKAFATQVNEELDALVAAHNSHDASLTQAVADGKTAVTTANSAGTIANGAVTTANSAVTTANGAASTAASAVTTANNAGTTAGSAVTTANNAVTIANTAVGTANTAVTNAATARAAAETAQAAAEAAAIDAAVAEGAVALKVDKAYVDQLAADFVLGAIPDNTITAEKLTFTPTMPDDLKGLGGEGRTTETVKGNADAIALLASGVSALDGEVIAHMADNVSHITSGERTTWNAKADQSSLNTHISDISHKAGKIYAYKNLGGGL